jgi:hypothetical protein
LIGSTVSHDRISEQLGAGGMGVACRVRDLTLGRDAALKLLPENAFAGPEARARFEPAARTGGTS